VASEDAYTKRGLTEAAVAVAVHQFLEEDEDEEVRAALERMQARERERGREGGRERGGRAVWVDIREGQRM